MLDDHRWSSALQPLQALAGSGTSAASDSLTTDYCGSPTTVHLFPPPTRIACACSAPPALTPALLLPLLRAMATATASTEGELTSDDASGSTPTATSRTPSMKPVCRASKAPVLASHVH
ncbi:unnamed protein product, partial [Tilletia laevis]